MEKAIEPARRKRLRRLFSTKKQPSCQYMTVFCMLLRSPVVPLCVCPVAALRKHQCHIFVSEDENDRASNDETNADPVEIADLLDDPEYKREADADAATADPTDVAAPGVSAQPITATVAAVGGEAALGDAAVLVSELYKNVVANMGADDDDGRGSQLWLRRGGRAQEKRRSVPETNAAEHEGSGESEEGELA